MTGDPKAAARAIDAIRRGWPIRITRADGAISLLAIESADDLRLASFDGAGKADVLLSAERAATLHLANQRDAATPHRPVLIARVPWLDLPAAVALADPAADLSNPFNGPYQSARVPCAEAASAALALARVAGVLPAFFLLADGPAEVTLTTADVAAIEDASGLHIVTRARLPISASETAEIVAFRGPADATEHVALLIGQPNGQPPIVRLHSECLTGDAFGSLKCDCGPQLDEALRAIAASGWGILLYLRQEGRGIGLINKLRAYALQDQGFDTLEANRRLGFAEDARDFGVAARMLKLLKQDRIRLLTNNPEKVAKLEASGIAVLERLPLVLPTNPHNHAYLGIKRDKAGHFL